jgi:hypothetical protein
MDLNLLPGGELICRGQFAISHKKKEELMKSQMMISAAVIGCVTAAMMSAPSAQERNVHKRAGAGHIQTNGRPNATARQVGNHFTSGRHMGYISARDHRGLAENGATEGQRQFGRVASENRYGRGWRGERQEFGVVSEDREGREWRGVRRTYEGPVGIGGAVTDYGWDEGYAVPDGWDAAYAVPDDGWDNGYYRSPGYSYAPGPLYAYAPDAYAPGYVSYGGSYYDYAPGIGIGFGPVGIGIGPAWGW